MSAPAALSAPVPLVERLSTFDKILYVVILGMLTAFGPVCTDIYLPALPVITRDLMSDPATIQLSLTASFFGLALGQIFIGPLSDAWGRKGPLLASLLLFAVTSLGCAMATDVWVLIVMRFFQGCAGSGGVVLSRSMACDMFKGPDLTRFMSLLMTINSLAPIFGPILGSALISVGSWQLLFYFLTLWGVLLLAGSFFKVEDTLVKEQRQPRLAAAVGDMFRELVNLRFLCLSLSMAFIMGGFFSYLAASPFVFQSLYGYSPFHYSLVFAFNAMVISGIALLAGRLSRRMGDRRIVYGSLAVMFVAGFSLFVTALIMPASSLPAFLSLTCFVSVLGASQTAGFGIVMDSRQGGAGAASGIFGVLCFLFGALMSPLVGLMGEKSLLPLALCLMASALFSFILFMLGLKLKSPLKKEMA